MKAITLYQPYASLVAVKAKTYETRSWATKHRGRIAIHAGMKRAIPGLNDKHFADVASKVLGFTPYEYADPAQPEWFTTYYAGTGDLPHGAIIATAELVECWHIVTRPGTDVDISKNIPIGAELDVPRKHPRFHDYIVPTEKERLFGDWTPGRYAWELQNITPLPEPLPFRGFQRIWNVPDEVIEAAMKVT